MSIGGPTVGQSINLELNLSATANSNLNQANFRTLAAVPAGQISISNFYGKSNFVARGMGNYYVSPVGTITTTSTTGTYYCNIETDNSLTPFGSITGPYLGQKGGIANSIYGFLYGGSITPNVAKNTIIYYSNFGTSGSFATWGTLGPSTSPQIGIAYGVAASNTVQGVISGGFSFNPISTSQSPTSNRGVTLNIATAGNASTFGTTATPFDGIPGAVASSTTRFLRMGAGTPQTPTLPTGAALSVYAEFASGGTWATFGLLNAPLLANKQGYGAIWSTTRGFMPGGAVTGPGTPPTNIIQAMTIATTGNSTPFGTLSQGARLAMQTGCSQITGICLGGSASGPGSPNFTVNTSDKFSLASGGASTSWGTLSVTTRTGYNAFSSNNHGGLG